MKKNKILILLLFIFIIIIEIYLIKYNNQNINNQNNISNNTNIFSTSNKEKKYIEIIDGDTIAYENEKIRYLGIDTPELEHPNIKAECYGEEATEFNKKLLKGKKIFLISDITDKDIYGRLLRYVFTDDGVFINYELVRNGYAQVSGIPPDTMFLEYLKDAQRQAKKEHKGIWKQCFNKINNNK